MIGPLLELDELEVEDDDDEDDEDDDELEELEELDDELEEVGGAIDEEEDDDWEVDCEDEEVVLEPRVVAYAIPPTAAMTITIMTAIAAVLETADTFFPAGKNRSKYSLKETVQICVIKGFDLF